MRFASSITSAVSVPVTPGSRNPAISGGSPAGSGAAEFSSSSATRAAPTAASARSARPDSERSVPYAYPVRAPIQALMPTPRPLASVRLSTSPACTRTSRLREPSLQASASVAPAEVAASTARRAASSSSPVMKRVAPFGAPSHRRSYGGSPDGHPLDPHVTLAGADRRRLPRLAAEAGLHLEVVRDRVDPVERLEAVPDQGRAPARLGHLPPLDQIALRDAEDEVAGRGLDLAAAERDRVEALLDLGDQLLRVSVARLDVGVGHP